MAFNPGVRTFQTTYDTEGMFTEFGRGDDSRIFRLCKGIDQLISNLAKIPREHGFRTKRRRTRRAIDRARFKVQNLITDCHWKLANYLIDNYNAILIPKFEVSGMVKKGYRKIHKKTVRQV